MDSVKLIVSGNREEFEREFATFMYTLFHPSKTKVTFKVEPTLYIAFICYSNGDIKPQDLLNPKINLDK